MADGAHDPSTPDSPKAATQLIHYRRVVQFIMEEKRLVRVEENKIVGGVCTGVAKYFGLRVGKVRLAWLILTLFATAGFWLYVILWLVLPLRNLE